MLVLVARWLWHKMCVRFNLWPLTHLTYRCRCCWCWWCCCVTVNRMSWHGICRRNEMPHNDEFQFFVLGTGINAPRIRLISRTMLNIWIWGKRGAMSRRPGTDTLWMCACACVWVALSAGALTIFLIRFRVQVFSSHRNSINIFIWQLPLLPCSRPLFACCSRIQLRQSSLWMCNDVYLPLWKMERATWKWNFRKEIAKNFTFIRENWSKRKSVLGEASRKSSKKKSIANAENENENDIKTRTVEAKQGDSDVNADSVQVATHNTKMIRKI